MSVRCLHRIWEECAPRTIIIKLRKPTKLGVFSASRLRQDGRETEWVGKTCEFFCFCSLIRGSLFQKDGEVVPSAGLSASRLSIFAFDISSLVETVVLVRVDMAKLVMVSHSK